MKAKFGESKFGIPVGMYKAKFSGVAENTHEQYGEGWSWNFTVTEGPFSGKLASRTTGKLPGLKNKCGAFVQMLFGTVKPGQEIDTDTQIGRPCQIFVEPNSTGTGTRVGSFVMLDTAAQAPPGGSIPF